MKGNLHPKNDITINPSGNETIREVVDRALISRRNLLKSSLGASAAAALGGVPLAGLITTVGATVPPGTGFAGIGFESIPPSTATLSSTGSIVTPIADIVAVPSGYSVNPLVFWGDPIAPGGAPWLEDASQTAEDQEKQYGEHTDGMHYFPLPDHNPNARGLLVTNNEYTQETIIHKDGLDAASGGLPGSVLTIAKIRKSQAAHGVSILEVAGETGTWRVVTDSKYGRRVTANTPMKVAGPAAGHEMMMAKEYAITSTGSSPTGETTDGTVVHGTANNCAHGYTPWGTYITCEENWNGYFGWKSSTGKTGTTKLENRYGVSQNGFSYKWHMLDDRWDVGVNPNEPHLFGWKVEIDPYDPASMPVKRTSLGRCKTESAALATDPDNRFGYYMGDDERNEYMYKWVCNRKFDPTNKAANKDLLDDGILYVAKFTDVPGSAPGTFRGEWIALAPDTDSIIPDSTNPSVMLKLRQVDEFIGADDAESLAKILIKARMAADAVGATPMDRPEWSAVRPRRDGWNKLEVYLTLTNNNRRGSSATGTGNNPQGNTGAGSARPQIDAVNPRPQNDYGHIIRWREDGDTVTATAFEWDIFVLCGDTRASTHVPRAKALSSSAVPAGHDGFAGNIADTPEGSSDFGAPDGLWFDDFGRLWIQTDQVGDGSGDWQKIGGNQMLCADPNTKQVRRFLTGPNKCEVTGVISTPDGKTMFVGIQHPGEDSNTADPDQFSDWPRSQFGGPGGRPRSGVVVIQRSDRQVIGS